MEAHLTTNSNLQLGDGRERPDPIPHDIIFIAWLHAFSVTRERLVSRQFEQAPKRLQVLAHVLTHYGAATPEDVHRVAECTSFAAAQRLVADAERSASNCDLADDIELVWKSLGWRPPGAPPDLSRGRIVRVVSTQFHAPVDFLHADGRLPACKEPRNLVFALLYLSGKRSVAVATLLDVSLVKVHTGIRAVSMAIAEEQFPEYRVKIIEVCNTLGVDPERLVVAEVR